MLSLINLLKNDHTSNYHKSMVFNHGVINATSNCVLFEKMGFLTWRIASKGQARKSPHPPPPRTKPWGKNVANLSYSCHKIF